MTGCRIDGWKNKYWVFAVVLFFAGRGIGQSDAWKAGEFGGIVTGKSTRKDMTRVFGQSEPKRGAKFDIYSYPGKGDPAGDVLVEVNRTTGIVETVTVQFSPNLTRTQAYKKYGRNYRETRYSIANCGPDGVNPIAYRDPRGPVEMTEYPEKGMVLWPNREGFDFAAAVYRGKPLPRVKPRCGTK